MRASEIFRTSEVEVKCPGPSRSPGPLTVIVTVRDPALLPELLAHLRACGCIAYLIGHVDQIEVVDPAVSASEEQRRILGFIGQWAANHPEAEIKLGR
jgi:hypothetical protein